MDNRTTISDYIHALAVGLAIAMLVCTVVLGAIFVTTGAGGPFIALVQCYLVGGLAAALWCSR